MLDYRPDLDPRTPGLVSYLKEMVPSKKGYISAAPVVTHTAHTYSLAANETFPNKMFASRWLSTPGGIVLVSTNQKINVYDFTNGFINVSKAGNYAMGSAVYQYGEDAAGVFDMCAFGDIIIACNKAIATQKRSALDLTIATLFADLTGAPKANTCCVASNFVFLGNCDTWSTVTGSTDILAWSAIGDYTDWAVNPTVTQCSYAQFNDTPGAITAVRPFRDGVVVFKAESMYYGRYVGAGTNSPIWDFTRVSDKAGCIGHRSIVNIDTALVFAGRDDFYIFDGTRPTPITDGIRETIRSATGLPELGVNVLMAHDKPNKAVWLHIDDTTCYVWNYELNRWGNINGVSSGCLCDTNVGDFRTKTLGAVTAGVQAFTTSSNHSNIYTLRMEGIYPQHRAGTTVTVSSTLGTGIYGDPVKIVALSRVNPLYAIAPASATLTIGVSRNPTSSIVSGATTVTMNTTSYRFDNLAVAGIGNLNFFRLLHTTPAYCEITGFELTARASGER